MKSKVFENQLNMILFRKALRQAQGPEDGNKKFSAGQPLQTDFKSV